MATGGVVVTADEVIPQMPARTHQDRPTGLPSVPKIYLNTTSRDNIRLLPPDHFTGLQFGPVCSAACGSCSLPNLTCDPEIVLARPRVMCVRTPPGGKEDGVRACGREREREGAGAVAGAWAVQDREGEGVRRVCDLHLEEHHHHHHHHHMLLEEFAGAVGGGGGLRRQGRRASGPTGGTKLSVYCSPRVPRRGSEGPSCGGGSGSGGGGVTGSGIGGENHHQHTRISEFSWLHNADVAKFIKNEVARRESNSSVESDSSLRSASHVSTCATSEYVTSRFTSCDRLSLPVYDLSPSHPSPPGRLRRIFSNPEAPFLKDSPTSGCEMRDSKSCSDLKDQSRPLIDHSDIERKLSSDATHLLSPPALLPTCALPLPLPAGTVDSCGLPAGSIGGATTGIAYQLPLLGSPPPVDGWEDRVTGSHGTRSGGGGIDAGSVSRDLMIRQWLQGVDPAIIVSQECGGGTGSGTESGTATDGTDAPQTNSSS